MDPRAVEKLIEDSQKILEESIEVTAMAAEARYGFRQAVQMSKKDLERIEKELREIRKIKARRFD